MKTEPQRNHTIDVARALSVLVVVIFHGFIYKASMKPDGTLEAGLWTPPTWVWGLSWVLMSMPLFFACGGFSNALIVEKMRRRGTGFSHYLASRGRRLTGGLALFVTFFAVIASAAAWLGHGLLAAELSRSLMFLLWFISVYLVIVLVAPFSVTLHDRFGAWVIVAMLIGIVVVDRAWLGFGRNDIGQINMFLVWPLCHQLGIGYQRGWFREGPRRFAWGVLVGSALAIVVLIFFFGYPASAVGFANAPIANHLPPTLAMALLGAAQVAGMGLVERSGAFASLPARTEAALARLSALMMTVYLWHVPAMLVGGAGLILLARLVPGSTPVLQSPFTVLAAALRHMSGREAPDGPGGLAEPHHLARQAAEQRRVEQHQAAHQLGPAQRGEHVQVAAHRMPDQEHRRASLVLDERKQLAAQVRPVARDRVASIVAELLDREHAVAGFAPGFEQLPVGAGREAVGVREDDGRRGHATGAGRSQRSERGG